MASETAQWIPAICVVGFHHARGPEIEQWFGVPDDVDPAVENDWTFLPFMALSDGAHAAEEDFSYFTLRRKAVGDSPATSLFGMSCTRQLDSRELIDRPADVTRSTVQKSVVIVAKSPHVFTAWREKLSLVTRAWFLQKDFTNRTILKEFQENLSDTEINTSDEERDHFVGVSLREFVHEFKHQALVIFKCCLLQPKMLFFSHRCERLCMFQFALISLIPGLIRALDDCADPELDHWAENAVPATSLQSSNRKSLIAYVGLPVQIFGKGSLFGPYTPLQQLDVLADFETKSYIVGSTNALLLQQKDRYSDIIVNLDEMTVSISSTSLRSALILTHADRRWIDLIYNDVHANWDPENPTRPRDLGFKGSEEYIRILFEQYIIAMLSAVKFHMYFSSLPPNKRTLSSFPQYDADPSLDFGEAWIESWKRTRSFEVWARLADPNLFDAVDPRHPTAGGFSVDDFNRRLAQELQDLHLDERFATSKDALSKSLASGQRKVSVAINNIWADFEARRNSARSQSPGSRSPQRLSTIGEPPASAPPTQTSMPVPSPGNERSASAVPSPSSSAFDAAALRARTPDLSAAQAALGAAGQKAGAYFSSWGSWAKEQRKGWNKPKEDDAMTSPLPPPPPPSVGQSDSITLGARSFEAMLSGVPERPTVRTVAEKEKENSGANVNDPMSPKSPRSPKSPKSPRRGIRRQSTREEIGSDGIGRLDA